METDKIRKAILEKATEEADKIIDEASATAREIIQKAKEQKESHIDEGKRKIISEAYREAAKIKAQASLEARQRVLAEKDATLNTIREKAVQELRNTVMGKEFFLMLAEETIGAMAMDKQLRIYVSPKDAESAREFITNDAKLKEKILEVKEVDCLGGMIAETMDGMVSIDNTFDKRIEMLIPKILPEMAKRLFGVGKQ